ncbi:sensor histidine kinase [Brevibacillus daliensis]|uniref:sensor histidine kinase n=1 Tax=Brevibacillus daliensis TaxID=2892995 RepID=UPI001E2EE34F|nr:HAMP domain-containing sensor histidine kinase [Brevibacillus daliensis]
MDGIIRILRRFIGLTILICAFLFVLNIVMLSTLIFKERNEEQSPKLVVQNVASTLSRTNTSYELGEEAEKLLSQNQAWAMLVDNQGKVTWDYLLPKDLPRSYTLTEVAKFSRNYLADYPVFIWEHRDGLIVVGYPKNSYAKYQFYFLISWIKSLPLRVVFLLIGNIALVLLLTILIGTRLIKSIKPLVSGIHALGREEAVYVESKGILNDLANSINYTSDIIQVKNGKLKARDEARSNWIAGISHDIRTPLSMVLGYASELEENTAVPGEQRLQAGIIRRQGEKLRSLINDLNLVSMLEYEMQPLNVKVIRLSVIARQVVSEFLNNGLDDTYIIHLHISDESIKVKADEKLLLRAITNLVQNSISHNPEGCEIFLETSLSSDHLTCQFIVSDHGRGIPQEEYSDLMELPYSSGRKRTIHNGHGLGLPMVARITKAHQGRLILKSNAGKGLRAIIELPTG